MSGALASSAPKRATSASAVQRKAASEQVADSGPQEAGFPRFLNGVQAKFTVSGRDDPYEREADAVARAVESDAPVAPAVSPAGSGATLQRKCASCGHTSLDGGECKECAQRKALGSGTLDIQRSVADTIARPESGRAIPDPVRGKIEPVLGRDLSGVTVHDDARANDVANDLQAKAFTHGDHIWLGPGQRADDVGLMAHEATHTVQQADARGAPRLIQRAPRDNRHPEDGAGPRARMRREIDEEVGEIEPATPEEARASLNDIDQGEKSAKSAELQPDAKPDVDRPAEEAPKVEQAQAVVETEADTPGEPIVGDESEVTEAAAEAAATTEGEGEAEAEGEGGAASVAEAAFSSADSLAAPMPELPVEPPMPVMPVNADGEPMVGDPAGEAQVVMLATQIETVRQGGFGLRIRAQQLMTNAALMRGNIELVSQHVGEAETGLVEAHTQLEFRQETIAESENALSVSEQKAEQVASGAPNFQSEAEEAEGESGPMAGEAGATAAENEANMPEDAEAAQSQAEQGQAMSSVSNDSATMNDAVGGTKQRAIQLQENAAQAQEKNTQTSEQIDRATETATKTEASLGALDGQAAAARGDIDSVKDQPATMQYEAEALDAEGQTLIASSQTMEETLHSAQSGYERDMAQVPGTKTLAASNPGGTIQRQPEAGADPQPGVLRTSQGAYGGRHEVNLGSALPGWFTGQGELTPEQQEKQQKAEADAAARRQSQLDQIQSMTEGDFSRLDAGDKASLAIQFMGQNLWAKVSGIGWPDFTLSGLGSMLIGAFDPRGPLSGVLSGLSQVASGTLNLFDPDQWARDPLGNLLKSAADIATGITIILGSITALAGVVIAIMAALIIFSFGFASPIALPVITFCGNVLVTVGGWTISVGLLALYYQSLLFIKNLVDAMTAETAEQLVQESGQMTADVEQAGQVAMQIGVAKLGQVGGRATLGQLDDLAGAAAQQGLSGGAAAKQVAGTFAKEEIKQNTIGQITAPFDLARAGVKKLRGGDGPAAPRTEGPEAAPTSTTRPEVETPPPRTQSEPTPRTEPQEPAAPRTEPQEPTALKSETPDTPRHQDADPDAEIRANAANKEGQALTQKEIEAEIHAVQSGQRRPVSDPELRREGYVEEVPLDNGHTWRRHEDGYWCRFSDKKKTVCSVAVGKAAPNTTKVQPVKNAGDGSTTSQQLSNKPEPVKPSETPESTTQGTVTNAPDKVGRDAFGTDSNEPHMAKDGITPVPRKTDAQIDRMSEKNMEAYYRDRIDRPPPGVDPDAVRYERHRARSRRKGRQPDEPDDWDTNRRAMEERFQSGKDQEKKTLDDLGIQNNNSATDAAGNTRPVHQFATWVPRRKPAAGKTASQTLVETRPDGVTDTHYIDCKEVDPALQRPVVDDDQQMRAERAAGERGRGPDGKTRKHAVVIVSEAPPGALPAARPSAGLADSGSKIYFRDRSTGDWYKWDKTLNGGNGGWAPVGKSDVMTELGAISSTPPSTASQTTGSGNAGGTSE